MFRKFMAIALGCVMLLGLVACGGGEETTVTGMVVSVEGSIISLMEMDTANMGERPEGMEGFGQFDPNQFDPEQFGGTLPEGETYPQWGEGEMPEGMTFPGGMTPPEGMERPENGEMPEFDGEMPDFGGENGGMFPGGFGSFSGDMETTDIDISDAHISLEIDGGKASGSMEDIQPGVFVTVTLNAKGQATNVLVTTMSFGGGRRGAN